MIGYTCVGTNDLDKAVAFYSELLSLLGAKPFFKSDRGVGWGVAPDKPMFSVLKPFDGQLPRAGAGFARQGRGAGRQGRGCTGPAQRQLLWRLFPRLGRQQTRCLLHGIAQLMRA